jgi:2Fe-2S ferredoxin
MEENTIEVTIIDRQGKEHLVEAPTDMNLNLMELCKANELPVKGTCGGTASCASCHIYILSEDVQLHEPSEEEEDMLDSAFFVEDNSRLGCQIYLEDSMNGLKVKLAPEDEDEL